jgi:tetratricopeptide (TPR) repeat protein
MKMTLLRRTPFFCIFFLFNYFGGQAQTPNSTRGGVVTSESPADTAKGNIYAIITGVSNYPYINPLKYADKDAILFRNFLKSPAGGSAKPENILSLINDSAKAADFNVKAYSWLKSKNLKKGDRLYIYFSGHGDAMEGGLYFFLPYDCAPNKDDHNYLGTGNIDLQHVKTLFVKPQTAKGVEVLLIMDACRTNELAGGKEGQQSFATNFIAEQKMGEIILLSTGPGQVSIESPNIGNGHGLFTYYLIDGLAGAADKDPSTGDNDNKVSLLEISSYTKAQVRKIAKTQFNTDQIPYSCCSEKDLETITKVDLSTYNNWENAKKLQQMNSDENLFAVNNIRQGEKGVGDAIRSDDSLQISIYNRFVNALKNEKLIGEGSAETYYTELGKNWPDNAITLDAKYSLAAKYLNFCQQKINLFISGKGLIHIIYMEKEMNKDNPDNDNNSFAPTGEQINKLKTLVTTGFDVAEKMMQKAVALLKNDPELLKPILPKYDFIKTMSAYADKRNSLNEVAAYCKTSIASDPLSPSAYLLMGWIYQDLENDSCEYYFKKAAAIAPKWAYPINGLGNLYFSKNRYEEAKQYFFKAVKMDSLYTHAYRNIGMIYYNVSGMNYFKQSGMSHLDQKALDSAQYFFRKVFALDSCDSYANEYLGKIMQNYISTSFGSFSTDNNYFAIAKRYFSRAIKCDTGFISGYQKLADLYSLSKNDSSAMAILQKCTEINPVNAEAWRNLGAYHLTTLADTLTAATHFKKAISLDPLTGINYYTLARLYRKQKNKEKAIDIYKEALNKMGDNKDLFNEIANTYFQEPSQFDSAIAYYNKALQMNTGLDYVYYNLGLLHTAKKSIKDSTIYYYRWAVSYNPYRWHKLNHIIAEFFYDKKDFNQAKKYYRQALAVKNRMLKIDVNRLVNILVEENNFAEAENTVNQYLNPETDKEIYTKLIENINKAKTDRNN